MSSSSSFKTLLSKFTVADLVKERRDIVTVDSKDEPVSGFQRIVENNVLSAPVYDSAAGKYIGFLDTRDLVQFVVFQYDEEMSEKKEKEKGSNLLAPPQKDLKSILDVAAKMFSQPATGITTKYLAVRNRFLPVQVDDPLLNVVQHLTQGAHRVPVLENGKVVAIVSQSTIIQFIWEHRSEVKDLLTPSIREVKIGTRPCFSVKSSTTAIDTLRSMSKFNHSGVAITDNTGRFLGCTSGTDLKLFIRNPHDHVKAFNHTILDFLSAIRQADTEDVHTKSPTIAVSDADTVEKVLGKLAATRIHRTFIANDEDGFQPKGVISITDFLKYCLSAGSDGTAAPFINVEAAN